VHLKLEVRDGEVYRIRARVGRGWRGRDDMTELGEVAPREAVDLLLSVVRKSCVFWLGQITADKATAGLVELVDDRNQEMFGAPELGRLAVTRLQYNF
jgi:hypothetical protein